VGRNRHFQARRRRSKILRRPNHQDGFNPLSVKMPEMPAAVASPVLRFTAPGQRREGRELIAA